MWGYGIIELHHEVVVSAVTDDAMVELQLLAAGVDRCEVAADELA